MRKKKSEVLTNGRDTFIQLSLFEEGFNATSEENKLSEVLQFGNRGNAESGDRDVYARSRGNRNENVGGSKFTGATFDIRGYTGTDEQKQEGTGSIKDINDRLDNEERLHAQTLDNFVIQNDDVSFSSKIKFERNMQALQTLNMIKEGKSMTADMQNALSFYSGWGGLPQVFAENNLDWQNERNQLKNTISIEDYQKAKASTLTSFYTPTNVISGIYDILDRLGFENGKILDPSMGTGNFFGMLPLSMRENSSLYGVELDHLSSDISKHLYPNASIQNSGFETSNLPNDYFDVSLTNVPFGRYKVHDIDYDKYNLDIHNYFFVKTLDKVRNGGLIAFITSTNTMDGGSNIRDIIASKANLVGAIRLPGNIFRTNGANTDVVSDIIFLQKLEDGQQSTQREWLMRRVFNGINVNEYFVNHPEMIFGNLTTKKNQFGNTVVDVTDDGMSFKEHLSSVIDNFPQDIFQSSSNDNSRSLDFDAIQKRTGEYFTSNDSVYLKKENEIVEIKSNSSTIKEFIDIKNKIYKIIDIQKTDNDEDKFQKSLKSLNETYDRFVKEHGYLNSKQNIRLFHDDPDFYTVTAMEIVDGNNKVKKSDFFTKRTIKPIVKIRTAEDVNEALSLSMNFCGNINLSYMETAYHKPQNEIIDEMLDKNLAYLDPETDVVVISDEYLSGDVRRKLDIAINKNNSSGKYAKNIDALNMVLPEWLSADEINAQLGATWIPKKYYIQFIETLFQISGYSKGRYNLDYSKFSGEWVSTDIPNRWDSLITSTWGVPVDDSVDSMYSQPSYDGWNLFEDILNSKLPTIYDYWVVIDDDGKERRKSRVNQKRTQVARGLAENMKMEFSDWLYNDLDRRENIEFIYNHTLNNMVTRTFDGSHLTFPDMKASLKLEDYQKNAVARIIASKGTLLSQNVGAGKTFEMVAACMEMKRMKVAHKSMIVVPNHLVDQWKNEFLSAYPQANILAATTKDFAKENRQKFIHKIAANDYDAIIIAHSSFKLIPMDTDIQINFMNKQIEDIEIGLENIIDKSSSARYVKALEKTKKSIETNIEKLTDIHRDQGITFDKLGIDFLFVDEAHEFKNLYIYSKMSNVAGVPQTHSQKAEDMYMKSKYIKDNGGGLCFATGTPISNTMAELYNLQRYLQEDELIKSDIYCFDAWAKNFGEVISSLEIDETGSGFKTRQRFSKFYNVQELMTMFRQVAEIQTESELKKALSESTTGRKNAIPPAHVGGKPTVISNEPSSDMEDYMSSVVERTEAIHEHLVKPNEDNMLKVTTDSKKASIDLRLIDEAFGNQFGGKLDMVVNQIKEIYQDYDSDKATQLVFCDSSVHHDGVDNFNVYDYIKSNLIDEGIPENEIAYIHDAKTEIQKTKLFNKVRSGNVRVLIGSTAKLGAGTNVQTRLKAIHHVDVPWRASDIEQRNGRAFRQGNMYDEIFEFRYVTKKSFDAYSWQMIETKATYMNQLLEGTTSAREIEENASNVLSYAEVKAIASGNPLIKERQELVNSLKGLQLEKQMFNKKKHDAEKQILQLPSKIDGTKVKIAKLEKDVEKAKAVSTKYEENNIEDWFSVVINGCTYDNMKSAGDVLNEITRDKSYAFGKHELGEFCGFSFGVDDKDLYIQGRERTYTLVNGIHMIGRVNFLRLLKEITQIPREYDETKLEVETYQKNIASYTELINSSFKSNDTIIAMTKRLRELDDMLDIDKNSKDIVEEEEEEEEME